MAENVDNLILEQLKAIRSDLSDESDIVRVRSGLYLRGNHLVRKFSKCSPEVKAVIFRSYMTPLYCAHLWLNYRANVFKSCKVAYNTAFRRLFNVSTRVSTSGNLVRRNLPTFHEILRKNTCSLFQRLAASQNVLCSDICNPVYLIRAGRVFSNRLM